MQIKWFYAHNAVKTYEMPDKTVLAFNNSDGNQDNLSTPDFILYQIIANHFQII